MIQNAENTFRFISPLLVTTTDAYPTVIWPIRSRVFPTEWLKAAKHEPITELVR